MIINPEHWRPIGITSMEPAALEAVKADFNCLVVAGPGAGKTELLAQKACYLLQTNTCPIPKRILAISFKNDAAANLRERVQLRCEDVELSRRFESFTFDGFSKSILDRFKGVLPHQYKISTKYEIGISNINIYNFLKTLDSSSWQDKRPLENILHSTGSARNSLVDNFMKVYVTGYRLDDVARDKNNILFWAADLFWSQCVRNMVNGEHKSILTFQMISRLAELIIRSQPYILKAVQATYSHVFLDEFQDTTNIQYDFLKSLFLNSSARTTAVGDGKQRIMLWAGALPDAFSKYLTEFQTTQIDLEMNYRCAPRLIDLQTCIAKSLEPNSKSQRSPVSSGGILKRLDFKDDNQEANILAVKVRKLIDDEKIPANEICFLFKQKVDDNAFKIIAALNRNGIKARNEELYQDLLKEELIQILLHYFKYIFKISGVSWIECIKPLVDDEHLIVKVRDIEESLKKFQQKFKNKQHDIFSSEHSLGSFIDEVIAFVGPDRLQNINSQYNKDYIEFRKIQFQTLLFKIYSNEKRLELVIAEFEGVNVAPCMTIHKSKGLEFEVVFFVGLEDGLFWNFVRQPKEDIQAVFVAVSRPMKQLYITFSKKRNNYSQTRNNIEPIYQLFNEANVELVNMSQ